MKKEVKIAVWIIFWIMAYFVLLGMFASSGEWLKIDVIYTTIFILTLMAAAWANNYYRLKTSYKQWALIASGIIMLGAFFNGVLFDYLIDFVLPGYYFISYYSFYDLLKFYAAFVGLTTLISLSIERFDIAVLQKENANAEFRSLVSQVNPHFLFNGLTVLYTLSLKDSKETSSAIIKLSDILRYVIYHSSENTVKLSSEASILRDYIDLQRYRVHPTTKIKFHESISKDVSVSPMLFLPLVENAFKHGVHNETENAFVEISLCEEQGVIKFDISNNKSDMTTTPGIGLKNLRDRLQLIYPGRHSFVVNETDNRFNVNLHISL